MRRFRLAAILGIVLIMPAAEGQAMEFKEGGLTMAVDEAGHVVRMYDAASKREILPPDQKPPLLTCQLEGKPEREVVEELGLPSGKEFDELTSPKAVTRPGSPEAEGV